MEGGIESPPETPRTITEHYRIEELKGKPSLGPNGCRETPVSRICKFLRANFICNILIWFDANSGRYAPAGNSVVENDVENVFRGQPLKPLGVISSWSMFRGVSSIY